jgi:hypothetical protein
MKMDMEEQCDQRCSARQMICLRGSARGERSKGRRIAGIEVVGDSLFYQILLPSLFSSLLFFFFSFLRKCMFIL